MPTKNDLLNALQQVQAETLRLAGSLNERERNTSGTTENWAARDVLVHLGKDKRILASDLAAARRGEAPREDVPEYSNERVFEAYQSRGWDEIQELVEQGYQELVEQVQAMSEEDLNTPERFAFFQGAPLWRRTAGSMIHSTVHLAQYYIAQGDYENGRRLAQLEKALGLGLDDSERWVGMVYYNQGCYHALLGEKEQALPMLEKGFALSQQFVDYAQQDPDLASLQADPDFLELLSRSKPPA